MSDIAPFGAISAEAEHVEIGLALEGMGLVGHGAQFRTERLAGGVSCDVFKVTSGALTVCLKRALPKLRVLQDWRAPPERSITEAAWMKLVARLDSTLVPHVLGEDRARHMFAMEYLPSDTHILWKTQLATGLADPSFAAEVGRALAKIHRSTAGNEAIAREFDLADQFLALRIEPYLLFSAERHGDVAGRIRAIVDRLSRAKVALMHGDISPKNILRGPRGPVFLDAETACYGDPAFDAAFCLNHLFLKGVWHPEFASAYLSCAQAFWAAYRGNAQWEPLEQLEHRVTALLSALMLARIDGKSPVEYLVAEDRKAFVRRMAKQFLLVDALSLARASTIWRDEIAASEFISP